MTAGKVIVDRIAPQMKYGMENPPRLSDELTARVSRGRWKERDA